MSGTKQEKAGLKEELMGMGQRLGKAILLPISVLPVAGLFLGVSSALTSGAVIENYQVLGNAVIKAILALMNAVGNGVFSALPLIFAIGIAVGLSRAEKGSVGLAAVVGYFTLLTATNAMLKISSQIPPAGEDIRLYGQAMQYGIQALNMNVFGGILTGIVTALVHNRFYKTKFPDILAFFGGSRFVPIVNTVVFVGIGFVMFLIWPSIAKALVGMGNITQGMGIFGAFLYGLVLRLFYIIGLHHALYLPFWTTAAGGVAGGGRSDRGRVAEYLPGAAGGSGYDQIFWQHCTV